MENQENMSVEDNKSKDYRPGQSASSSSSDTAHETDSKVTMNKANSFETGNGENKMDKVKDTAKTLVDQAKSTATDAYTKVAEKATSAIEEHKSGFAGGLSGAADTVRRVSGTISDGESKNTVTEYAAKYTETAAQKLESAAQYFEGTDLRGFARDAETYARRNPAIFLGAAFAIGILAARFIKSPSPSVVSSGAEANRQLTGNGKWENGDFAAKSAAM